MFTGVSTLILFAALAIVQCPAMAQEAADLVPIEFNGVRIEMEERAHDGNFPIGPNRSAAALKIDANSVLALRFLKRAGDTTAAPTAEWRALERALSELKDLTAEFEKLSRLAANLEDQDLEEWRKKTTQFGESLASFLKLFDGPQLQRIVSKEEMAKVRRQASRQGKSMYVPLAELLEAKRRDLIEKANRLGVDLVSDRVSVVAYVIPRSGQAQQIHVPGYDDIETKPLQALSRTSPIPSEAEAKRLRDEYKGAEAVAQTINEIRDKRDQIGEQIRTLGKKLADRAKQFADSLLDASRGLEDSDVTDLIKALADAQTDEAKRFRNAVGALQDDLKKFRELSDRLESVVRIARNSDALTLMLAMGKVGEEAAGVKNLLANASERIGKWSGHLAAIAETAPRLSDEPVLQGKEKLRTAVKSIAADVVGDMKASRETLVETLPELKKVIDYLANESFVKFGRDAMSAADSFDPAIKVTAVNLDQAKDTDVDLRRSGIALGDSVELKISLLRGVESAASEKTVTYAGEAVLTGWHRRYSGDVIFARATSGPGSDSFKPNAGVSVEWHYFDRSEQNGFWNWLDPGFGFHAANLDQNQDQTVELGAGVNVSAWNGLLRLGYGYNLSVKQDHPYFWIGFGLFGLLNRLNDLPSFKP